MLDKIKSRLSEYEIAAISKRDFDEVFEVYDSNQDFFLLTHGEKATVASSMNDVDALPPNCSAEQKSCVGIRRDGRAVGVLDLVERYPDSASFWIGLLLVHGEMHGKGIGSGIANAILNAGRALGYESAQLGVIESNASGLRFWQKHGFMETRRSGNIVVMAKRL